MSDGRIFRFGGRHDTEFEQIQFLGKGAFGSVTKVRNKLDGRVYSLKKILLPSERKRERILREARLLAGLNHDRIQRYYNCWLENIEETVEADESDVAAATHETKGHILRGDSVFHELPIGAPDTTHTFVDLVDPAVTAAFATMTCSICHTKYIDWEVTINQWKALSAGLHPLNLCQQCYMAAAANAGIDTSKVSISVKLPEGYVATRKYHKKRLCTYLFILMEYCDFGLMEVVNSLAPRLDTQARADKHKADDSSDTEVYQHGAGTIYACTHVAASRIWQLFWQIVEGLAYIHSCQIVHRDLKPSNVFASGRNVDVAMVKIGDLGLATTMNGDTVRKSSVVSADDHEVDARVAAKRSKASYSGYSGDGAVDIDAGESRHHGHAHDGAVPEPFARMQLDDSIEHFSSIHEPHPKRTTGVGRVRRRSEVVDEHNALIQASVAGDGAHHKGITRGVGTYLYMAPEAEHGIYSDKSDMFSLGVVLYEMWSRFDSQHERVHLLDALKRGAVPRAFIDAFPVQAQLISNLLQEDPDKRPSASDLLRYRFFNWAPSSTLSLPLPLHRDALTTAAVISGTLHVTGPLSPHHPLPTPGISAVAAAYRLPTDTEGSSQDTARSESLHIQVPEQSFPDPDAMLLDSRDLLALERADVATLRANLREAWNTIAAQAKALQTLQATIDSLTRR